MRTNATLHRLEIMPADDGASGRLHRAFCEACETTFMASGPDFVRKLLEFHEAHARARAKRQS